MSVFKKDFTESIEAECRKISAVHNASIESLILNYLELTGLSIDEIELVEKRNDDMTRSYWCQKRKEPGKFWQNAFVHPAILKVKG